MLEHSTGNYESGAIAQNVSQWLNELRARLTEELSDRAIYYVPPAQAKFVTDADQSFGSTIVDNFPHMKTDLGEAAVCLGLSRNTACVFHLMRAVESAVRLIGDRLGATIFDKNNVGLNWGCILQNVNAEIEKKKFTAEKRDKWSEVSSQLFHVKNCWRNQTMHPKQTYSDEEATEIFLAVKSFLRCLARQLSP